MNEHRAPRTFYRPTPQLVSFIDSILEQREWKSAGAAAASMAVLKHTGQSHLLIDEKGKEYNEQSLYELIRRRIEAHVQSMHAIKLVPAPQHNGSLDTTLLDLMQQVSLRLWAIADKGDADTLRDILALLK